MNRQAISVLGMVAAFGCGLMAAEDAAQPGMKRVAERRVVISGADREAVPAQGIGTIAGTGVHGYSEGGGQALSAQLDMVFAVAADAQGNVYIADTLNHRVRRVTPNGTIATVAGTGQEGSTGDGGPATSARLSFPRGVAVDTRGNLYIADSGNFRVRRVSPDGTIATFAGNGTDGYAGDGGQATSAQMRMPRGLAADAAGNLYIADSWNFRVRRVDTNGIIRTVAGNGQNGYTGDGSAATNASIGFIQGIAVDSASNLYLSDALNHVIRRVGTDGIIRTLAGTGTGGWSGDGGAATAAQLKYPRGLALDPSGSLYVADSANHRIRQVDATGTIKTVAGTGQAGFSGDSQAAVSARLNLPYGLGADASGAVYISDLNNYRIRQANLSSPATIAIATASAPPQGALGVSYNHALAATGGTPPYTWALVSGGLPPGLTLASNGVISGTPTAGGAVTFSVRVTDATGATATQTFTLAIVSTFTITTDTALSPGFVGGSYFQGLTAIGGNPPYAWSVASGNLPAGLTLSASGAISGVPGTAGNYAVTIRATESGGASASKAFTLTVLPASSLTRGGTLSHLVGGGGWKTTITLVNPSTAPLQVRVALRADDGAALTLPLLVTAQKSTQAIGASTVDRVLNPNATLIVETAAPDSSATLQGWADVLSSGAVRGFAIFRQASGTGSASEGTVPLLSQSQPSMVLPYDNTGGFLMGVAIANLAAGAANITATVWDENGVELGVQSIPLAGNGHGAFVLQDRIPLTLGKRGVVEFRATGGVTGLGLRFSPFGTFTSVPSLSGQ